MSVAPVTKAGIVYGIGSSGSFLTAFDRQTFVPQKSYSLVGISGFPAQLVSLGDDRMIDWLCALWVRTISTYSSQHQNPLPPCYLGLLRKWFLCAGGFAMSMAASLDLSVNLLCPPTA
jgi:hypothetical protein